MMTVQERGSAATMSHTDDTRWAAVCKRDALQDEVFVFAVRTTKIYCRPSCASRPAKRENVTFFQTPKEAEAAGYRACKRCRPDQPHHNLHAEIVQHACDTIKTSEQEPSLSALAERAGMSAGHFQRVFKMHVGLSPKGYAQALRKQRLREALADAPGVTQAIFEAGYTSSSRAYAHGDALGMPASVYRSGAKGETIRFTFASSSLGELMIAATARGLCTIEFGERPHMLERLKNRFHRATLEPADEALTTLVAQVVAAVDGDGDTRTLTLDTRGTAFQERVWQALRLIPRGETVSYAELAARIGQPTAARAVAGACAANTIAVVVPCHRVVEKSGKISGYRWGPERKRALLAREAKP